MRRDTKKMKKGNPGDEGCDSPAIMSYMDRIAMTKRELHRTQVLKLTLEGQLPLQRAAELLGVSYRHALRLKNAFASKGPPGLIHGN